MDRCLNVASISAPSFVNAKAADVILSDVRPTSITPDALRAVNILLDELLWLSLAHARSFEMSRLKSGVLKAIPTQLGKDAILEAEIEIRAYRNKTQIRPRGIQPADDANATFPLQEAFDVSTGSDERHSTLTARLLRHLIGHHALPANTLLPASYFLSSICGTNVRSSQVLVASTKTYLSKDASSRRIGMLHLSQLRKISPRPRRYISPLSLSKSSKKISSPAVSSVMDNYVQHVDM
jgi:hypothetical protein